MQLQGNPIFFCSGYQPGMHGWVRLNGQHRRPGRHIPEIGSDPRTDLQHGLGQIGKDASLAFGKQPLQGGTDHGKTQGIGGTAQRIAAVLHPALATGHAADPMPCQLVRSHNG